MRLAFFTPWPPQRSGVAGRSAEVVPLLAAHGHAIDVFVDERDVPAGRAGAGPEPPAPGGVRVLGAHDFVWRQARAPYDLTVYQLGNSRTHEFIWPYLFRWPGLVILHETRLHHARGRALLQRGAADDYRREFAWNHPETTPDAAELAVAGFGGVYYYEWPMTRGAVEAARLVAVHSRGMADELASRHPGRPIEYIALGEGAADLDVAAARTRARARLAVDEGVPLFGVFGGLTADKRVPQILAAFAATRAWLPDARLLLAGAVDPLLGLSDLLAAHRLTEAVTLIEELPDAEFDEAIAAVDVSLNLRWPTAGEVSGPWLRALAAGRATVTVDLGHLRHVPSLDPRTWKRHQPVNDLDRDAEARAVTVAVDILDEAHSLRLAMRRLGSDAPLRDRLGRTARAWWEAEHTVGRMLADLERALVRAAALPPPAAGLPAHVVPDGAELARDLVAPFGIEVDWPDRPAAPLARDATAKALE